MRAYKQILLFFILLIFNTNINLAKASSIDLEDAYTTELYRHKKLGNLVGVNVAEFVFTGPIDGLLKSVSVPAARVKSVLKNGLKFDGSSIKGCSDITDSDMHLTPDTNSTILLPSNLRTDKTALIMCDIGISETKPYVGDPRYILKNVCKKLEEKNLQLNVGAELEFYIIDKNNKTYDDADYFDHSINISTANLRNEILGSLIRSGITIEKIHHEVGPGQWEVVVKYEDALKAADNIVLTKHIIKSICHKHNLTALFMPKPINNVNGNGMHIHYSIYDKIKKENIFFDNSHESMLSDFAHKFIAGNLALMKEVGAIFNPTINSYKRLIPGYEAPIFICWGIKNRSALIRIPLVNKNQGYAIRAELRCPDPSCNPYLAFAAIALTGIYGVENDLEYFPAIKENLYKLNQKDLELLPIEYLARDLTEALNCLEKSSFAKENFSEKLISEFIKAKREEILEYKSLDISNQSKTKVSNWEIKKYSRA